MGKKIDDREIWRVKQYARIVNLGGMHAKDYGYCATCFKRLFPTDERALDIEPQSHEMRVRDAILTHFKSRPFVFDRPLYIGAYPSQRFPTRYRGRRVCTYPL